MTLPTPPETHEQFLANRRKGIGGSDCASIFNAGYGCRRRLWYEKRGTPQDFPREETGPMKLGKILEPFFAEEYVRETGRRVETAGQRHHAVHPELLVNVDRMIEEEYLVTSQPGYRIWIGSGVLEIKSVGRANFFKIKREGMSEDHILQVQHGMLVTGAQWGAFCVGSRDSGDILHWDVPANLEIHKAILVEGPKFWATVENGPMPGALEPDDKRCQNCAWRTTCHGNALIPTAAESEYEQDESLAPLVREYIERRALRKEADDLLDETKEELQYKLGDRGKVMAAGAKIQYYGTPRKEYVVPAQTIRALRVYPGKERP